MRWLILALHWLTFRQIAASFTLGDHSRAVSKSLQRAQGFFNECTGLDRVHVENGRDPLQAASDARPVFRQYLLALRHLMAFMVQYSLMGGAAMNGFLAHAGELDLELSQLAFLAKVEPYYFWHGPKRHVPAKLEALLNLDIDGRTVNQLLTLTKSQEGPGPAVTPAMALPELGLVYPVAAKPVEVFASAAVRVHRPGADACAVGQDAVKAGIREFVISGTSARSYLLPCLDARLQIMWDTSDTFADIWTRASEAPLQDVVDETRTSLNRASLDVLGLPPKAWFDKRLKDYIAYACGQLLKKKQVKAIALVGALPTKQLQKILGGRFAPSIWLAPHDDCNPITPSSLEAVHKSQLKVMGYGVPCGAVLDFVAEQESLDASTLLGRWTAELGLAVVLPHTILDLAAVMKRIQDAPPLSSKSWRLLSGTAALSRTAGLAVAPDFEDSFGLRDSIKRASDLATSSLLRTGLPAMTGSLGEKLWQTAELDKAEFEDNFFIIYKDNFLSEEMHARVKDEAARLWRSAELEPNCNLDGGNRTGGYVLDTSLSNTSLYKLFYGNEEFRQWVSRINGHQMYPSDFPIELREYPAGSSGMGCHRDLLMYTNATLDLEFVYTIDNLGTCITTFTNRRKETTEVHTRGNSLIMVRPNAAMHCVKPSYGGHRTILKFIYVGDFRKSSEFGFYATNECPQDNPNVQAVLERRQAHQTLEL